MNLPALSAEIVHRIRNSIGDSAHNQATMVQNLIAEAMPQVKEQADSLNAPAGSLEGLRYALEMVQGRRILNRPAAYLSAVDEMEIFLMAAIERVKNGEPMYSTAVIQ